jgi:Icc-related predicted phosphoesterase
MKILCLSDLHGDTTALGLLKQGLSEADLILVAGDFTDFGGRAEMASVLAFFAARKAAVAAVGGNCDRSEARRLLDAEGLSVDGKPKAFKLDGGLVTVIGAGGGLLRTGLTPYERKDAELSASFEAAFHEMPGPRPDHGHLIALSHNPPHGCDADLRHGVHVGSKGLRNILDALAPVLWVCGHIHESRSVSRVGPTLVVNPGSLREGNYAVGQMEEGSHDGKVHMELKNL